MSAHISNGGIGNVRRKSVMDRLIETLATGLGNSIGWMADHGILFGIFALLWVAFAAGLALSQGSVDQAWTTVRGLPLIVQVTVWLVFLPVMIGLWVWESSWPLAFRVLLVVSIAAWNLLVFLPKAAQATR
jgi:ABC-type amino acid transport system permease subunit